MIPRAAIFRLFWMVFGVRLVLACSCARFGPVPCGKFSPTSVVFVGTVESIENPPPDFDQATQSHVDMRTVDQGGYSRYHFDVLVTIEHSPSAEHDGPERRYLDHPPSFERLG